MDIWKEEKLFTDSVKIRTGELEKEQSSKMVNILFETLNYCIYR